MALLAPGELVGVVTVQQLEQSLPLVRLTLVVAAVGVGVEQITRLLVAVLVAQVLLLFVLHAP
jgi:hypothetical protein